MEQPNLWILPVAAIIPLALGFIWYNPKVFGNAWMKAAEISEERAKSGNMLKIFGLTYLFSLFAAYVLNIDHAFRTSSKSIWPFSRRSYFRSC